MQRQRVLLFLASLLYVAASTFANAPALAQGADAPAAQSAEPEAERPHIAAILPLRSVSFAKLGDAVRRGIQAAAAADRADALPLVIYPTGDDAKEVIDTYDRALRLGARLVLGPLTRNDVQAIANSHAVTVPTLALSIPDGAEALLPDGMYALGVQIESEARQIARLAQSQGRRRAVIIAMDSTLGKRLSQAFADDFARAGRLIVDQFTYTAAAPQLKKIKEALALNTADMIFFAMDGARARAMRPYLGKTLPGYGTSLIYAGATDAVGMHDLNGMTFVDMPWVLMPDHPAVMIYPRAQAAPMAIELERFYALGIDAWRLGQVLLDAGFTDAGTIDGVTGYLSPGSGRMFVREAVSAQFIQGQPKLLNPVSGR